MKFRIDLKIFIFLVIFYFTKQIEIYTMIMFFAVLHELGHLIVGLLLKMRPEKLEVKPFGLSISFIINTKDYNIKIKKGNLLEIKKIIVALAGPITNLIIIYITSKFMKLENQIIITYSNILITLFNLLPIYPLDGGRVLKGLLYIIFGKMKSEEYINDISKISIIIITAISSIIILYYENIAIFLIDIYLWFLVIRENKKIKRKKIINNKIKEISKNA